MNNRTSIIKQPDKISFFYDVYKLQKKYQDSLISGKSNINFGTSHQILDRKDTCVHLLA